MDEAAAFNDIRQKILSRGYHKTPLCLDGLSEQRKIVVIKVLGALLTERDEEVELRERLLMRNKELEQSLERTKKSLRRDTFLTSELETKLLASQSETKNARTMLADEQLAHRGTKDQLLRTRKQFNQIQQASSKYRAATERQTERLKERMSTLSHASLKALVPDIRIASPAFVARANPDPAHPWEKQILEIEKYNTALLETSTALKQLALDAFTTLYEVDIRLKDIIDVECGVEDPSLVRAPTAQKPYLCTTWDDLELHQMFPPLRPLVTDDTEYTHPARRHLTNLAENLQSHVESLSHWAAMKHFRSERLDHEHQEKRRKIDGNIS